MSTLIRKGSLKDRPKPPSPDELKLQFSEPAIKELNRLLSHYPDKKSAILPCLWIAQREYGGFLSPGAIAEVAFRLGRSYAEIEGVATFYSMYNTDHHVGKHMIEVCTCLSCHVCGAYRMVDYLEKKLGIKLGETTDDGLFTLHEVECLNACDRAPLIQVGPEYHGPVDEKYMDQLIENLRKQKESSVVQLADDIVKVQLSASDPK